MIAAVRAVWSGPKVTVIIVRDAAPDQHEREHACFVFMPEGQFIAALCEQAAWDGTRQPPPLVLTLEPKTRWGHKITEAELLPETRARSGYADATWTDEHEPDSDARPEPHGSLSELQMHRDRVHGKNWKDI